MWNHDSIGILNNTPNIVVCANTFKGPLELHWDSQTGVWSGTILGDSLSDIYVKGDSNFVRFTRTDPDKSRQMYSGTIVPFEVASTPIGTPGYFFLNGIFTYQGGYYWWTTEVFWVDNA